MSELHIEHHQPKRTKEAIQGKKKFFSVLKELIVDMIPVILGILIALSFNGIKEGFKEKKEEKYFLERLQYDLKEDLRELNEDISNYRYRKYGTEYLNKLLNQPPSNKQGDSAYFYFVNLFGQTAPNITNAAYLTLTSSGKLDIIHNKKIVEGLVNLYTDVTVGLCNITTSFNEFKQKYLNDVVYQQIDFATLDNTKNLNEVLTNKQIKNALHLLWFDETIGRYQTAIAAHEKLIELIEEELNH